MINIFVNNGPAPVMLIIGLTFSNNIAGVNAKIYGTINAAIASLVALNAVFIGGAFAIAEPAYAANATGGVMSATIPK